MDYNAKIKEIDNLILINKKLLEKLPDVEKISEALSGLDNIKQNFANGAYNDAGGNEMGNLDRGQLKPNYDELNSIKQDIISLKSKLNIEISNLEQQKKQLEQEKSRIDLKKITSYNSKNITNIWKG